MDEGADYKAIALLNRAYMGAIWRKMKKNDEESDDEDLNDEEELVAEQMMAHPEYNEVWENIEDLGDRFFDPAQGENPFLHITMHVALERQLRSGEPPCVRETMERLTARGMDCHEAQHAILRVLVQEMWGIMTQERSFDVQRYSEDLKKL